MKKGLSHNTITAILFLITVLIGIFTNIATGILPELNYMKPYLWLSFPLLGLSVIIYIYIQFKASNSQNTNEPRNFPNTDHAPPQTSYDSNLYPKAQTVTENKRDWLSIIWFTLSAIGGIAGFLRGY